MRRLLLAACLIAAATAPAAAQTDARVLMYHRFGEDSIPSTNIRLDQLRAHLEALKGRPVLPLPEVVAALKDGRPLPDGAVAITVDDGYASVFEAGWPMLKAAGVPFTVFVATEPVGKHGYMTWDQIRALRDAGVTIGLHSDTHPHLPELSPAEQRADLERSLAAFARELGERPTLLAWPYGEADASAIAIARDLGFAAAFGQHSGVVVTGEPTFYLPRFALNEHYGTPERFAMVSRALPLPATDIVPQDPTQAGTYAFTVTSDVALDRLTCFGPDGERAPTTIDGRRVTVTLKQALPPGRARVNCTMPGPNGRWYWRGTLFTVPAR